MIETVRNLRQNLQKIGSNLIVSMEKPEQFIPKLFDKHNENIVVYQQEICSEEIKVEEKVQQNKGAKYQSIWGSTLHHIDDIGYNPKEYLPHIYGKFREKHVSVKVRKIIQTESLDFPKDEPIPGLDFLPKMADFGFEDVK